MPIDAYFLLHAGVQKFLHDKKWPKLHAIQSEAIQRIYETEDHLLITASTAGGKTEAAFLPVISKLAEQASPDETLGALYVGPLKALINDQFERLNDLCAELNIPVHRWHGDVSGSKKQGFRKNPAGVLLITPESLESNFINYGSQVSKIYHGLQFIVIDELHSFLGNVRGMHLLSLLCRLAQTAGCRPRIIGLSATLGDVSVGKEFLSLIDGRSVAHVDDASGGKGIRVSIRPYGHKPGHEDDTAALKDVAEVLEPGFRRDTNLIFVNSRRTAESLTLNLQEHARGEQRPADCFTIHHGSISKELRETTEMALKQSKHQPLTVVCSSTLEMGIDIGNIRAVGQVDPPWSVSSLRQRLGRSGRRDGEVSRLHQFAHVETSSEPLDTLQFDLVRAIAMIELMVVKWLEPSVLGQYHFSTLVFQILSVLRQTGGIAPLPLYAILCEQGAFRKTTQPDFVLLLRHLKAKQLIEQMPDLTLILAPAGEHITHDKSFYAAFSGNETYTLRHGADSIGELPVSSIPPTGQLVILAARRWLVEDIDHPRKVVWVLPARAGVVPRFIGSPCSIHSRVSEMMCSVLLEDKSYPYLHETAVGFLQSARHTAHKLNIRPTHVIPLETGGSLWFPWVGSEAMITLQLLAKDYGLPSELEGFCLRFKSSPLEVFRWAEEFSVSDWGDRLKNYPESLLQVEKYDEFVPVELLHKTVRHDRLDLARARTALTLLADGPSHVR